MKKLFSLAIMAIGLAQAHAQDVKIEFITPSIVHVVKGQSTKTLVITAKPEQVNVIKKGNTTSSKELTVKQDAQGNLYEIDASGNAVLYKNGQVTQDSDGAKNTFSQDFEPSVHVYVDNSTDDQITVIVVDVNRNINQW